MLSFGLLSLLLGAGVLLRRKVGLLQRLYLPASVVAGLIGLFLLQGFSAAGLTVLDDATSGWGKLPGGLINIVFASLFLGHALPPLKTVWRSCSRQLAYGQIVAWGQYAVGCGVVLLALGPLFGIPDIFAGIMPVGFEGGHGTAGGMGPTFDELGYPEIKDFALAAATGGMLGAILVGMALVNWAVRRGHVVRRNAAVADRSLAERPAAGRISISTDVVGALSLQLAFIGIAILLGWLMKEGIMLLAQALPGKSSVLLSSFPLFPLCMLGGVVVQILSDRFDRHGLIDAKLMLHIQNGALDFLVVAAIATIRLDVIASGWLPLTLMIFSGIAWNVFCLTVLARRVLRDSWFERGIAEMGQSMGVTATGLLLLRVVDPDYETEAASAFAAKQLLHEPFMGGGLWTGAAIPLLALWGGWPIFGIAVSAILIWMVMLSLITRRQDAYRR